MNSRVKYENNHRIEKIKELVGHESFVYSVVFFKSTNQVVSSAWDGSVRIWNLETGECEKIIRDHGQVEINHIIKMNEHEFISCGNDGNVMNFRVPDGTNLGKFTREGKSEAVFKMLKLTDDLFLTATRTNLLHVISYSSRKVVKRLYNQNVDWNARVIRSEIHENCFYISLSPGKLSKRCIRMINYSNEQEMRDFNDHDQSLIHAISTIVIHGKTEYLIAGGHNDSVIYVYNSDNSLLVNRIQIEKTIGGIFSFFIIQNRYLVTGGDQGCMSLSKIFISNRHEETKDEFFSSCPFEIEELTTTLGTHNSGTEDLVYHEHENDSFTLFSSSTDKKVCLTKFSGVVLWSPRNIHQEDLLERLDYIYSEKMGGGGRRLDIFIMNELKLRNLIKLFLLY